LEEMMRNTERIISQIGNKLRKKEKRELKKERKLEEKKYREVLT
jgi:hypothetical protein